MKKAAKRKKWNWRSQLTPDEAAFIREADAAAKVIADAQSLWNKKYQAERILIVNRAVHRAQYHDAKAK